MSAHATIIAGFGGQGLLFAGQVLAEAANLEGLEVSWMPSYGPEMRGGTASCTVIVADGPIGSPIVDAPDCVIALNPPSMAKFEPTMVPGGLLVVNTTLIEAEPARADLEIVADGPIGSPIVDAPDCVIALNPPSMAKFEPTMVPGGLLVVNTTLIEAEPARADLEIVALPCTALARAAGNDRLASVVALGALVARRPIVSVDVVRRALAELTEAKHPELLEADLAAFEAGFAAAGAGVPAAG